MISCRLRTPNRIDAIHYRSFIKHVYEVIFSTEGVVRFRLTQALLLTSLVCPSSLGHFTHGCMAPNIR